ncbi:tyrosine-type recombinase/integrase [Saccharopolyspora sp. HNM0983]|uniref:Tyrosine-type recombinase/integrase n=1 Tax=Saccharopolyspora montiporae TaxID=2781240 RepID=A0A929B966_9PSEU|nr:tyrosine-type recombinase/integrase [Saccharopolyspora sp. HNM0983]MBE9375572.1 tyrosine-type recombinase/integrase [Saccharopolyspora sp. HNM0983]
MTETSYEVRIWTSKPRKNAQGGVTSYPVRWRVGDRSHYRTFKTRALAESFRADLVSAARRGEAFYIAPPGLPVSAARRAINQLTWFEFSQRYVDLKWPRAAAKSRAGIADTLATVTPELLATERGKPDGKVLRRALTRWLFNTKQRQEDKPPEIVRALRWLESNTVPVSRLAEPGLMRQVLEQLASRMDGAPAGAKTFTRKRAVLHNALEYAVELGELESNVLPRIRWTPPREAKGIDKRVAVNPNQARRLLRAVGQQWVEGQPRRSAGPGLVAFFGVMYYSALRPEEAAMLRKQDLNLPERGWGELLVSETAPVAGAAWTDSGQRRDRRHLKQRGRGEVRPVPCPPELTELLHDHLSRFGAAGDGRLFRSLMGGDVAESTVARVWDRARYAVFTADEYASPLARRPYDLRHACVSTWLGSGVPSTQVAEWAGHSVAVLHQVYAKVLAGQEDSARRRIEEALKAGHEG